MPLHFHLSDFHGWYPGGNAAGVAVGAMAAGLTTSGEAAGASGTASGGTAAGASGAVTAGVVVSAGAAGSPARLIAGKDMSKISPTTNFNMIEFLKLGRYFQDAYCQ